MSQVSSFFAIYLNPLRAFGRVIDEGRLGFAVALFAVMAVQGPRHLEYRRITEQAMAYVKAHAMPVPAPPAAAAEEDDEDEDSSALAAIGPMPIRYAVDEFVGFAPFHCLSPLVGVGLCFVPAVLLIVTLWDGLGRFWNVFVHDYLTLLVCALTAWAAAYLPLGIVISIGLYLHKSWAYLPLPWWIASGSFCVLCACALRTLTGTSLVRAAAACAGGWVAGVAGVWVHSVSGSITWYLASPCVLYYLYANLEPSFYAAGYGFRSRQRMKQMLEAATINPGTPRHTASSGRSTSNGSSTVRPSSDPEGNRDRPWRTRRVVSHGPHRAPPGSVCGGPRLLPDGGEARRKALGERGVAGNRRHSVSLRTSGRRASRAREVHQPPRI